MIIMEDAACGAVKLDWIEYKNVEHQPKEKTSWSPDLVQNGSISVANELKSQPTVQCSTTTSITKHLAIYMT